MRARFAGLAIALVACGSSSKIGAPDGTAGLRTLAPAVAASGNGVAITCVYVDSSNNALQQDTSASIAIADSAVIAATGSGTFMAAAVGTTLVTCSDGDLVDPDPPTVAVIAGGPVSLTTTVTPNPVAAGDPATVTCAAIDASGNVVTGIDATIAIADPSAGIVDGDSIVFTAAGSQSVGCLLPQATTAWASETVTPGPPATLIVSRSPDQPLYRPGSTVTAVVTALDLYGNVTDASGATVASAPPESADPGPLAFTYSSAGTYALTATLATGTATGAPITGSTRVLVSAGAPAIECTPTEVVATTTTSLSGTVTSPVGLQSIAIDGGTPIALGGATSYNYSTGSIPVQFGANSYLVEVVDTQGLVTDRHCPFDASPAYISEPTPGTPTPAAGSLTLALGQPAVDEHAASGGYTSGPITSLGDIFAVGIPASQLSAIVGAYLGSNTYLGDPAGIDVYYDPTHGVVEFTTESIHAKLISTPNNGIRALLSATGLSLGTKTTGTLTSGTGSLTVSSLTAQQDYTVGVSGGVMTATATPNTYSDSTSGVNFTSSNILVSIGTALIPSLVTTVLQATTQNLITVVFNDILGAITVPSLGVAISLPKLDGTGNITLTVGGSFASADANATRLRSVISPTLSVSGGTLQTRASAGIAEQQAIGTPSDPPLGSGDVGLILHDEAINAIFHQLWRYGLFDATLSPDGLAALGIDTSGLTTLMDDYTMSISAQLPPIIQIEGSGDDAHFGLAGLLFELTPKSGSDMTPYVLEITGVFDTKLVVTSGYVAASSVTPISVNAAVIAQPEAADGTTTAILSGTATEIATQVLTILFQQSIIKIPLISLHIPQTLGPIVLPPATYPTGVTLQLKNQVLSESATSYPACLLVDATLSQ